MASGFSEREVWSHISTEELQQFEHLYLMSDFHARLETATALLKSTRLFVDSETNGLLNWTTDPAVGNSLIIVLGDYVSGGNESIEVVRMFEELRRKTPARHKMVLLIGNHEAQFFAGFRSRYRSPEMMRSLSQVSVREWLGLTVLGQEHVVSRLDLLSSPNLSRFRESLRLGAVVGRWLFAHGGYFGISTALMKESDKTSAVCDYVAKMTAAYREGRFDELTLEQYSTSNFLMDHQWWRKKMDNAEKNWDAIGIRGLVQGHSRFSMGYCEKQLISCPEAWPGNPSCSPCRNTDGEIYALQAKNGRPSRFIKIDTGIKYDMPGRILSCPITPKLIADMDLAEDCVQMDRDGNEFAIPTSFNSEGHYLM